MTALSLGVVDQAMGTLRKVEEYIKVGMDTVNDTAQDIIDVEKDNAENKLSEMKDVMTQYCKMQALLQNVASAVDHTKQQARAGDPDTMDLLSEFDTKLKELENQSRKTNFESHEKMAELLEKIDELNNPDEPEPTPATTSMDDSDADIAMTQQEVNTKCPFTGMEMKNPVMNKHCKHNYDREGILQYVKSRGSRARCPVGGCPNTQAIEEAHLIPNKELRKLIEKKNRDAGKRVKKNYKRP